jgi:hypothetical protein
LRLLPVSSYTAWHDTHVASVDCFALAVAQVPSYVAIPRLVQL